MSKMWTGPCAELQASFSDKLAYRLHRRASRLSISYTAAYDGRSATVNRFEKRGNGYVFIPLGEAHGGDVMNLWINIALEYTPLDSELIEILTAAVQRRSESVLAALRAEIDRATGIADVLAQALEPIRGRYV